MKINIQKGVLQDDINSPKLFNPVLEDIFTNLKWEHRGIKRQGEYLSNSKVSDEIVIFVHEEQELKEMITEFKKESSKIGLIMNNIKTKITINQEIARNTVTVRGKKPSK